MAHLLSGDIFSGPARKDLADIHLRTTKSTGDFSLRHRPSQTSDLDHFGRGQSLSVGDDIAEITSVLLVGDVVHPLKISGGIVGLIPIDVIDHRQFVGIGGKGQGNETVNVHRFDLPANPQVDPRISIVDAGSENLALCASNTAVRLDEYSVQASDAAEATDLVVAFEANYGSPFFSASGIHTVGCPSAHNRLTIKDPPRAATFGGSALFSACPPSFQEKIGGSKCQFH